MKHIPLQLWNFTVLDLNHFKPLFFCKLFLMEGVWLSPACCCVSPSGGDRAVGWGAVRYAVTRGARDTCRMLQMVRTLAQFTIALDEMQESGESTSDDGAGGGAGEEVDRSVSVEPNGNGVRGSVGAPQTSAEVWELQHWPPMVVVVWTCCCVCLLCCFHCERTSMFVALYRQGLLFNSLPVIFSLSFSVCCVFLNC